MKMVECRELSVEGQSAEQVPRLNGAARSTRNARRGFTLVELLIAIMIIGILAAAVLGVAAVAGETAREARTRNLIARIHTLLMQHYETYNTRRVRVNPDVLNAINGVSGTTAVKGRLKAEARMYALRELMLMEVPDRWSDVALNDIGSTPLAPLYFAVSGPTPGRTELGNLYLRKYLRLLTTENKITGTTNTPAQIRENQGAECLYMVVMNACGDGEARTLFPESMIGDTDGDGANEFIDGWGHPIEFLRWAPGFESDIQYNAGELDAATNAALAWTTAASADHDPFDLYRSQPNAFRLVPLVYSWGRDEEPGLINDPEYRTWRWNNNPVPGVDTNFNDANPQFNPPLNPYGLGGNYPDEYLGITNAAATDNLHNHLIGTR
jgi:prepilin-type N-terminal cleavage/methylation domain-containing protein